MQTTSEKLTLRSKLGALANCFTFSSNASRFRSAKPSGDSRHAFHTPFCAHCRCCSSCSSSNSKKSENSDCTSSNTAGPASPRRPITGSRQGSTQAATVSGDNGTSRSEEYCTCKALARAGSCCKYATSDQMEALALQAVEYEGTQPFANVEIAQSIPSKYSSQSAMSSSLREGSELGAEYSESNLVRTSGLAIMNSQTGIPPGPVALTAFMNGAVEDV
mmetsp:Transcript_116080/g.259451  ORF Transcript_116080/g.259451 Transcript_116080/m.259451 type:complete len:219 (+) Transcript_116080:275-931(+)